MMYKAKVAVCSDIRTKRSTQSQRYVEFLNVKPCRYVKKLLGFRRLIWGYQWTLLISEWNNRLAYTVYTVNTYLTFGTEHR